MKEVSSATYRLGNLPALLTTFVGRGSDCVAIRRRLGSARLLTLTGVGGVGKTRLALEVAGASAKAFPDGAWLVDLTPVREPSEVASAAARALGMPDRGTRPVTDQLIGHLAGRRTLIVLDNCEHLADTCAHLTQQLLTALPELRVLATSRHTLGVPGEHVFVVSPLPPDDAHELLLDRAEAIDAGRRISAAGHASVAELCAGLDGLPLAIELAASRLRTLSVQQVTERLGDRFALLTHGSLASPPRQRSLLAMIDSSYDLCTPSERLLWNRLSVFAGVIGLDAAEDICSGDGIHRSEVLDLLDRLVAQSIALPTEAEGRPYYRLLESIRHYGQERLTASGEAERLSRRHRDFYRALAERTAADWYGPGQREVLARLRAEHDNLLAALEYGYPGQEARTGPGNRGSAALTEGRFQDRNPDDAQARLALTTALRFHWCCNGFIGEGRRQFDRALATAPTPNCSRAKALWAAAWVAMMQGDFAVSDRWLAEADQLGEQLNDRLVHAYVKGVRASSALYRGRPAEAVRLFEDVLAVQAAFGEAAHALQWRFQLALAQLYLGDPRAQQTARHAVTTAEAHGELLSRSYALWALGYDAWLRGHPADSNALMRASLEIQRGFNDYAGVAGTLEVLAWSTEALGDHEQAARLLGALRLLTRELSSTSAGPFAEPHELCVKAIVQAIGSTAYEKAMAEGGSYDTPHRAIALAMGSDTGGNQGDPTGSPDPLTRREREVAVLVAEGRSNKQIATTLRCSPRTVDSHVQHILAKLAFSSRTQIATWWAGQSTHR